MLFGQSGLFENSIRKGTEIILADGDTDRVNLKRKINIKRMFIFSINNDNTDFYIEVIVDRVGKKVWPILLANNRYFRSTGKASSGKVYSVSFRVNREQAEEIGKVYNVPCSLRKHFGHELTYEFIPLKDDYKAGDSVFVKFKVTNVGDVSIWYNKGGAYRNSNGRCNNFNFEVYYNDVLLPDEGPKYDFGGRFQEPELKPGETDSIIECITKWSHFSKPGKYTIRCTYQLNLKNEDNSSKDYPDNQEDLHKVWDEKAEKKIEIIIK